MSISQAYVEQWIGYWSFLSNEAIHRWGRAMDETRRREYGVRAAVSDLVGFWGDAASAWYAAVSGPMRQPQTVVFELDRRTESAEQTVPLFRPSLPADEPEVLWLGPVGGLSPGKRLSEANCVASWSLDDAGVDVALRDLAEPNAKAAGRRELARGAYQAVVHAGDVPIAKVYVRVK